MRGVFDRTLQIVTCLLQSFVSRVRTMMQACFRGATYVLDGFAHITRSLVETTRLVVGIVHRVANRTPQRRFGAATGGFERVVNRTSQALDASLWSIRQHTRWYDCSASCEGVGRDAL